MANALPVNPSGPVSMPTQPVMPPPPAAPAAPVAPVNNGMPAMPGQTPPMMATPAGSSKKSPKMLMGLVALLLIVGGVGAYWMLGQGGLASLGGMSNKASQPETIPEGEFAGGSQVIMATESTDEGGAQAGQNTRANAEGSVTKDTNCYTITLPAASEFGDENSCNQYLQLPGLPSLNLIIEPIYAYKNFATSADAAAKAIISGEKVSEAPLTVGGVEAVRVVDATNASGDERISVFVIKPGSAYTVQGESVSGFEISAVVLNLEDKAQRMAQLESALSSIVWK